MSRHRVGIIGLGTVGSRFVEQFGAHPRFDLVAAWDPDPDACRAHADDVAIGADAAEVIAASDLVYIAVPPRFHREYCMACLEADTAIFCEKPLGIDVAESRALVDAVERSGVAAAVNFVFAGAPSGRELVARVQSGELGDLVGADLRLHFAQWPRAWHTHAQWLRYRDQGGWIREVASHFLFLAQRALGPLRLDTADVVRPDGDAGELCESHATARFSAPGPDASPIPLLLCGSSGGVGPDVVEFTVRGTRGSARTVDWYRLEEAGAGGAGDAWRDVLGRDRASLAAAAYRDQLNALAAMLAGEDSPMATFAEALAVQELVEAVLRH